MNNLVNLDPPRAPAIAQPLPALDGSTRIRSIPLSDAGSSEISQLLTRLISDESALYAITREWRYDASGRRFVRLHALLDEQFSEIGSRLVRLAARSRDLGRWVSTDHGDRVAHSRTAVVADAPLEAHMIRELLGLHEAMGTSLRTGSTLTADRFHDRETTELLADLTANHEKDAFMLRALLWEVENNPV